MSAQVSQQSIKGILTDAIRYWEPRRIPYNLVLALIAAGWFVYSLPGSWVNITIDTLFILFILAVLANICYCAAYVADVVIQLSDFRDIWFGHRWILFALGLLFASAITYFVAGGMFAH